MRKMEKCVLFCCLGMAAFILLSLSEACPGREEHHSQAEEDVFKALLSPHCTLFIMSTHKNNHANTIITVISIHSAGIMGNMQMLIRCGTPALTDPSYPAHNLKKNQTNKAVRRGNQPTGRWTNRLRRGSHQTARHDFPALGAGYLHRALQLPW